MEKIEKEEEVVAETKSSVADIEKMVQNWEAEQKENAQMIQAKLEEVEQERAKIAEEAEPEEEPEEILPNDVRALMEALEAESAEISAQKTAVEEVVEEPAPVQEEVVEEVKIEEPEIVEKQQTKEVIEDNKAVIHVPIFVPSTTNKILFPLDPIVIPAATIEIKIVVIALED